MKALLPPHKHYQAKKYKPKNACQTVLRKLNWYKKVNVGNIIILCVCRYLAYLMTTSLVQNRRRQPSDSGNDCWNSVKLQIFERVLEKEIISHICR